MKQAINHGYIFQRGSGKMQKYLKLLPAKSFFLKNLNYQADSPVPEYFIKLLHVNRLNRENVLSGTKKFTDRKITSFQGRVPTSSIARCQRI
jgi:hypothetical protein